MKNHVLYLFLSAVVLSSFICQESFAQSQTPFLPKQVDTSHNFGISLIDDFANLNNLEDPMIAQWLKSQDSLAEAYFLNNDLLQDYLVRFEKFENRLNGAISMVEMNEEGNYFYLQYDDSSGTQKLYFKENLSAEEVELFDAANHNEITYLKPSFDGKKIAIGFRSDQNFSSTVRVLDVKNKKFYREEIIKINPSSSDMRNLV